MSFETAPDNSTNAIDPRLEWIVSTRAAGDGKCSRKQHSTAASMVVNA